VGNSHWEEIETFCAQLAIAKLWPASEYCRESENTENLPLSIEQQKWVIGKPKIADYLKRQKKSERGMQIALDGLGEFGPAWQVAGFRSGPAALA